MLDRRVLVPRPAPDEKSISLADIKAATDNFDKRNLIGAGGFGNVYRGVLRDGTRVAVKHAKGKGAWNQGLPAFQTEITVLSGIRHRHLVSLIGCCNKETELMLVYEYMEKGTLPLLQKPSLQTSSLQPE